MSFFSSLHALAQRSQLSILVAIEGDDLRVNVTPFGGDPKAKPVHPLSLIASPAELDAAFVAAVAEYTPSVMSVLEQAKAAAQANSDGKPKALPAPAKTSSSTSEKPGKRSRTAKAAADPSSTDGATPNNSTDSAAGEPEVDPRQTAIPGLDDAAEKTSSDATPAHASATMSALSAQMDAAVTDPTPEVSDADEGVDLF